MGLFARKPASEKPDNLPSDDAAFIEDGADDAARNMIMPTARVARKPPEVILQESGQVSAEQLQQARDVAGRSLGKSVTQVLMDMQAATEPQILAAMAQSQGLEFVTPERSSVDDDAFNLLPPDYMRKHRVLPIRLDGQTLILAMAEPSNVFLRDEIQRKLRKTVQVVVAAPADMIKLIEQITSGAGGVTLDEIIKDVAEDDITVVKDISEDVNDLAKAGNESPIIKLVNHLIMSAIQQGASDIHIEPKEKGLKIRFRIDGILFEQPSPPYTHHAAIVSRLKIMANLDIAERRLPQDGRIRAMVNDRKIDLRMSTLPTASGEKVVMRILDNRSINVPLEHLGFGEDQLLIWRNMIDQPHGIILVTGPTGSGKTTTLYSSLRCMDGNKLNISTVEDPVEYHLTQASQVQVHDRIGMTFAAALKSLLRQDPDVVMLGEIRDAETARIAVQASLTGHLVLSTLHTNDAPASITRLINVGVEPYLISASLNAILAQRLVRKICQHCKEEFVPSDEMREFLTLQGFEGQMTYHGKGCDRCRKTGYAGRLGIYELLVMDDRLRDLVTANPDVNQLRKICRERGLVTLREDGFKKVMKGLTTVDEILRVTENGT